MNQQIILLYAGQYRIVDERTGEINEGVTCNYYFNTNLTAEDHENGTKGTRPAKGVMDYETMSKIKKAPALYNAEFELKIGADKKPVQRVKDLEFVDEVQIVPLGVLQAAAAVETGDSKEAKDSKVSKEVKK